MLSILLYVVQCTVQYIMIIVYGDQQEFSIRNHNQYQ